MTPDEITQWQEELAPHSPAGILTAVAARFPGRIALATGFGAEGCVLVDVVARARLSIDIFTLDTGYLFPETYALWRQLEQHYGVAIRGVTIATATTTAAQPTWQTDPDACCHERKVQPLRSLLAGLDAWVTAIRSDQTPERASARCVEWDAKFGLVKVNPLVRWTSRDVHNYIRSNLVPTNPLHERGYTSIGCAPCTTPVGAKEDARAGRWRGRQKTECGIHSRPHMQAGSTDSGHDTIVRVRAS